MIKKRELKLPNVCRKCGIQYKSRAIHARVCDPSDKRVKGPANWHDRPRKDEKNEVRDR